MIFAGDDDGADPAGLSGPESSGPHSVELVGLLHELTAMLLGATEIESALADLSRFAAFAVPGVARCSVLLITEGRPAVSAASETSRRKIDDVQQDEATGPSLDSIRTREPVVSIDLRVDDRWPALQPAAVGTGLRTAIALPIDVNRDAVGALTLYLTDADAAGPSRMVAAMAIAGQAALLLGEVLRREEETTPSLAAQEPYDATVNHAVGLIMAQRGCGPAEAFEVIDETATRLAVSPRVVAERLLETAQRRSAP
ncbi:transcriptional regulator with GAF, ATPase, and Fis domain [Catenuloplanes nepalensis]|uniref:Transcriptional regulator with GAF, ATPase, and Fis domain n=1 Tax=Catenuloplanes nepalensis TaxID=587533 RepID=A0ABT9N7Y3_9ACTN|nr:GAF and ANTAR domain-containing protein [Catenuloplanes nepalensis]MDP9799822.1 transcriptional regulator with GAF, ATPase, and Fis domain [Catenuloplanes nepalensis]